MPPTILSRHKEMHPTQLQHQLTADFDRWSVCTMSRDTQIGTLPRTKAQSQTPMHPRHPPSHSRQALKALRHSPMHKALSMHSRQP